MQHRLAALAMAVTAVLAATPAHAGLAPQITDPTGDVTVKQPAYDIVSVTFDTTKNVTYKVVKKKRVKVVTPKDFTITMTLAGPVDIKPGTSYQIVVDETPCGDVLAYTYFSVLDAPDTTTHNSMVFGDCGPETAAGTGFPVESLKTTISGNTIVWSVPMRGLPPGVKAGSTFSGLHAYTAPAEPVLAYSTMDFAPEEAYPAAAFDYATTDKSYRLGS